MILQPNDSKRANATGMSGKLLETLQDADRMVEAIARDLLATHTRQNAQAGVYAIVMATAGGLSEVGPAAFSDLAPALNPLEACHPVVMLATADHNCLPQTDVLEALLYIAGSKTNCRQTAERALQAFGSVGGVLSARIPDLITMLGIHDQIAYALKAIYAGMRSVLQEPIRERVLIQSFSELIDYLSLDLKHETVEVLRVLYLDRKNGLISDEEVNRGTVDHVPLYPREIVKRALQHGASAIIMVHNHPSGDPRPSSADVNFSCELQRALNVMGILMHDSLIVGRNGHASLRALGHL
jgi:DNA repair protein RadC